MLGILGREKIRGGAVAQGNFEWGDLGDEHIDIIPPVHHSGLLEGVEFIGGWLKQELSVPAVQLPTQPRSRASDLPLPASVDVFQM